jgi:CheY-like chemotaxis protein
MRAILVVDDEEAVRHACLKFVARLGYRGLGAADGEEAVALFAQHAAEIPGSGVTRWTISRVVPTGLAPPGGWPRGRTSGVATMPRSSDMVKPGS